MDFHRLPVKILKRIFAYLSFDQIAQLRGLSRSVHSASRETLNAAFLDLGPRLVTQYTVHLINTKNSIDRDVTENTAFRGRLLKLLRSEHSILLAFCRYYITRSDVGCFSAGKILDLFHDLLGDETRRESQDENNKVAKLVLLIDQYLDWFEGFRVLGNERCWWFGACVVDILDSYIAARYHLVATHNESMVKLAGQYTVNGYAEAPPEIGDLLGREIGRKELLQVLRYLRKHARWHNFVRAFQDDCDVDSGAEEEQEKVFTKRTPGGYDRVYKKKSHGFVDSTANVVCLRAIINLQCHQSLAPARLSGRYDATKISSSGRDVRASRSSTFDDSATDDWMNSNELEGDSSSPPRSLQNEATWFDSHRNDDGVYSFSLELKSVHPKKWSNSHNENGEKFGETTLNINHTPESIVAAQSEFRLY